MATLDRPGPAVLTYQILKMKLGHVKTESEVTVSFIDSEGNQYSVRFVPRPDRAHQVTVFKGDTPIDYAPKFYGTVTTNAARGMLEHALK